MPPRLPLRALTSPLGAARFASSSSSSSSSTPKPPSSLFTPSSSSKTPKAGPSSSPSSPAKTKSVQTKSTGPPVIPPLPRPLGIPVPPTSNPKSWSQRKQELLDEDRHKAKRKALVKEATQGYFHDYNRAKGAGGGKLWIAPNVLIREDKALYFPDISGRSLLGQNVHSTDLLQGKTSLVSLISTRISEEHVQSFIQPVVEDVEGHPGFNFVQINHQTNQLKSLLLSFLVSSLKRTIPESRWGTYFISGGEWSEFDVNQPLGLENKLLGYVFLVDENLKVRWAGCGPATDDEAQSLRRATAVLLGRMKGDTETASSVESEVDPSA
ncbi:hypothetical protein CI109_103401 [Kwoniella shandongensis]|uniref:Uncharacterized protein n=1 Tax=Kwoniella shandongensis TaxID=1734106 RepID=A0A5M6BYB0_9TREE|nr:uncharacterized protein CI109_004482 [Kwoniella shandongensis]KAA5527190.1 hypothetical protein CI109_004482 [Kwoniella shandongensis]